MMPDDTAPLTDPFLTREQWAEHDAEHGIEDAVYKRVGNDLIRVHHGRRTVHVVKPPRTVAPTKATHLIRENEAIAGKTAWCGRRIYGMDESTYDPERADCLHCLRAMLAYHEYSAAYARKLLERERQRRLHHAREATQEPPCPRSSSPPSPSA